jgi:putative flippase GtrA
MRWKAIQLGAQNWVRFLLGGIVNAALSYSVYLVLNLFLGYQWAYLAAYACGMVFSYCFNAAFVFEARLSWRGLFSYPAVYLIQYGASALLLGWLVESGVCSEAIAPLPIVILTLPLTFIMSKVVIRWSESP